MELKVLSQPRINPSPPLIAPHPQIVAFAFLTDKKFPNKLARNVRTRNKILRNQRF